MLACLYFLCRNKNLQVSDCPKYSFDSSLWTPDLHTFQHLVCRPRFPASFESDGDTLLFGDDPAGEGLLRSSPLDLCSSDTLTSRLFDETRWSLFSLLDIIISSEIVLSPSFSTIVLSFVCWIFSETARRLFRCCSLTMSSNRTRLRSIQRCSR